LSKPWWVKDCKEEGRLFMALFAVVVVPIFRPQDIDAHASEMAEQVWALAGKV